MTKFMNIPIIPTVEDKKKEFKPTVFTHYIDSDKTVRTSKNNANEYQNVIWLGDDKIYGDIFKAWNDKFPNNFTIFFGVKGDEEYS